MQSYATAEPTMGWLLLLWQWAAIQFVLCAKSWLLWPEQLGDNKCGLQAGISPVPCDYCLGFHSRRYPRHILNFDCLCEAREIKGKLELYNKKFFCCFVLCQLSPYRKKLLYIKRKSYLYNIVHGDSTSIWKQVIPSQIIFVDLNARA